MITGVNSPQADAVRVLLLSAYDAASHRHWQREFMAMFPDWHWQVLTLPARHFAWRMRGNPLSWALSEADILRQHYDAVVATSMVDLATLRGLIPSLGDIPSLLYFHENQFVYPRSSHAHSSIDVQMVSLYSALAATGLAFNSCYNRDSFLDGVQQLLKSLPDHIPPGVVDRLRDKAHVLPVPLQADAAAASQCPSWPGTQGELAVRSLRLLWSGRFEHDKGGQSLLLLLQALEASGIDYELAVTGQQFRKMPAAFDRIESDFSHRLVHFGFVHDEKMLHALQWASDIILSTADHEFQGLAVLQAVVRGCLPAVPDRLAYQEIYPELFRYPSVPSDPTAEAAGAAKLVTQLEAGLRSETISAPDVSRFSAFALRPRYQKIMQKLVLSSG
ncbi:MAG: DUF3524 domain-containing protein [Pseudomonadota bacterium]